jgi:replicative DNA helicase
MAMDESSLKRILPHSEEAEKCVIGSMLISEDAVSVATEMLTPDDFYEKQYALLFETMAELANEHRNVDPVTVQDRLREKAAPPEISDMAYVSQLARYVPTSANIKNYAKIVSEKATLRRLIHASEEVSNECYQANRPVEEILDDSEKRMFKVFQAGNSDDYVPINDSVLAALDTIMKASATAGHMTGIPTGFRDIDYNTSGFQRSDLILIAARPSMGKTAFALNIAENMCFRKDYHVAIFSLEMSRQQLINRLFAMESHVNSQSIRNGTLNAEEWEKVVESADIIGKSHLMIDDTPGISVREMRTKCRQFQLKEGLDCVIIDYLQLMTASGTRSTDSRQQEISEISRSLKGLARELNVPVVALSQLSRAVESRPNHRPMLSDLRESGAIEQDADVVMFLYRDDYYNKDSENKGVCEIIIAKQRNGPIGTVNLAWLPDYTKFETIDQRA